MNYSVLIAAPLLIAAIVMAVRFVGCTQDFDQFEPHGNGEGRPKPPRVGASLTGEGTLSGTAAVAHDPEETDFPDAGAYSYDIPPWCIYIDLILLGGGGGGAAGVPAGPGGAGGTWQAVTLWLGSGQEPADAIQIPADTTSISITVGAGGAGGAPPAPGGDTIVTVAGVQDDRLTAHGGDAGVNPDPTGTGPNPQMETLHDKTVTGGADQPAYDQPGNPPGGGGAGGFLPDGAGADGGAWVIARQTLQQ